jgi:hypothetical protein
MGFKVPISGANYVSDERKRSFEEALEQEKELDLCRDQASGREVASEPQNSARAEAPVQRAAGPEEPGTMDGFWRGWSVGSSTRSTIRARRCGYTSGISATRPPMPRSLPS